MSAMDGTRENPVMYFDENGNGPNYHVCADVAPAKRVRDWMDRERLLPGGLHPEAASAIERLIEDLR